MLASDSTSSRTLDLVAMIGLAIGAALGMAGTFIPQPPLRQLFWAIDETGLTVATVLLAIKFLRRGDDAIAAGFFVFALGETLLLSSSAAGLAAGAPSYAGGVALWAAGLLLVNVPPVFPVWGRLAGIIGAILFIVVALRIPLGHAIDGLSRPLPFFAYPFLVLSIIGWIVTLSRKGLEPR
jgi:hypothetical protein